jgi:hypothetical protein
MPDSSLTYADFMAAKPFVRSHVTDLNMVDSDEFVMLDPTHVTSKAGVLSLETSSQAPGSLTPVQARKYILGQIAGVIGTADTTSGVVVYPTQGCRHLGAILNCTPDQHHRVFQCHGSALTVFTVVGIGSAAFDALDSLRTPQGEIADRIASFQATSQLDYKHRLTERLNKLFEAQSEEEGWQPGSGESLRLMLQFLEVNKQLRQPTITLTPDGMFRAEWTNTRDEHLAISFEPDGLARFVVFSPENRRPRQIRRVSGVTPTNSLAEVLAPYRLDRWRRRLARG